MKTRLIIILITILSGCTASTFLPDNKGVGQSPYGSLITVTLTDRSTVKGELITADSAILLIKSDRFNECHLVSRNSIKSFKVQYAQVSKSGWTIPVFGLLSLSHGYWGIISLPANVITTTTVALTGRESFTIYSLHQNDKQASLDYISYDKLYLFARYPLGLPPGLSPSDLIER